MLHTLRAPNNAMRDIIKGIWHKTSMYVPSPWWTAGVTRVTRNDDALRVRVLRKGIIFKQISLHVLTKKT
jgi:hypothetical protein